MNHTSMSEAQNSVDSIVDFMDNDLSPAKNDYFILYIPKIKDIPDGKYSVIEYEEKQSKFGVSYKITAIYLEENGQTPTQFWSNSFLSNFIQSKKPRRKFNIKVIGDRVHIDGYSNVVKLM